MMAGGAARASRFSLPADAEAATAAGAADDAATAAGTADDAATAAGAADDAATAAGAADDAATAAGGEATGGCGARDSNAAADFEKAMRCNGWSGWSSLFEGEAKAELRKRRGGPLRGGGVGGTRVSLSVKGGGEGKFGLTGERGELGADNAATAAGATADAATAAGAAGDAATAAEATSVKSATA